MRLWISSNMGKLTKAFFIFVFAVGSFATAQEANDEIIPYNLKAALKSVLNNHKTILATKSDIEAAKLRLKLLINGNGCAGSTTSGVSNGNIDV